MPASFPPGSGPGPRASTGLVQPTDGGLFTGPVEAIHSVTWPRPTGDVSATVGFFDAGGRQCVAASFIASAVQPSVQQVSIGISTSTSFADTLVVALYSDSGGTPGGLIDSVTVALNLPGVGQLFTLPSVNLLTPGSTYWIVLTTGSGSNYITGQVSLRYVRNTSGSHPSPSDTDSLIGSSVGSLATWTEASGKISLLDFHVGSAGIAAGVTAGDGAIVGSGYDGQGHGGVWVRGGGGGAGGPAGIASDGTDVETGNYKSSTWRIVHPYGPDANITSGLPYTRLDAGGSDAITSSVGFRSARRSDGSWVAVYRHGSPFAPEMRVQTWDAVGGFGSAQDTGAVGYAFGLTPVSRIQALLIDDSGNAHIIWSESDTEAFFHRMLTPGGTLGAVGTWEAGLIAASEFVSNAGVGCAYNGGVAFPYIRNDGCFRMALWPADASSTVPTIKALPQTISPADAVSASILSSPGCLAAYGERLYCFHRVTSGASMGVATYDAGLWTGSVTTWNDDVTAGAISAAYLPTMGMMGVLFNTYFQYWDEPGGGYPAFTDYDCAPPRRARSNAQIIG